jgi:hypothetical protein
MPSPKNTLTKLDKIINAWETIAPTKTFGGMTLEQFKAAVKRSYETRQELHDLESRLQAKLVERDQSDVESMRVAQLVVNGVKGDPTEGPNSDLYDLMGYVRNAERRTGLTRKKKNTPKP